MTDSVSRNSEYIRRYKTRKQLADKMKKAEIDPKDVIVVRAGEHYLLYSDSGELLPVKSIQHVKLADSSST